MQLTCIKTDNPKAPLLPAYGSDWEKLKKIPNGNLVKCEYIKGRNYKFLCKFMAMVRIGHENTKLDMPFDTYRKLMTMRAGFYKAYDTGKGTLFEAKSIAFDKMEEDKFEDVYSRVLDKVMDDVGLERSDIEAQLITFM